MDTRQQSCTYRTGATHHFLIILSSICEDNTFTYRLSLSLLGGCLIIDYCVQIAQGEADVRSVCFHQYYLFCCF
jgi:hypothetical protein